LFQDAADEVLVLEDQGQVTNKTDAGFTAESTKMCNNIAHDLTSKIMKCEIATMGCKNKRK
jgi:hypothetical protein